MPEIARAPWRHALLLHWRMTRPAFLLLTLSACVLGLATAAHAGPGLNAPLAVLTVLLACTAHAGANVLNDFHDAQNGADAANESALYPFSGGSRLIQQGVTSESQTARWAWVLLALPVPVGLWLAATRGSGLALVGLAGLVLAWSYSAPPLKLMSRSMGEAAVALAWWLVVMGADYVQRGQFAAMPVALGLSLALLVAALLLVNEFPDAPADASVGKQTLVVRLGARRAAMTYLALVLAAPAVLVGAVGLNLAPPQVLTGLLALPLSLRAARSIWRHQRETPRLRPAIALSIAAANLLRLGHGRGADAARALRVQTLGRAPHREPIILRPSMACHLHQLLVAWAHDQSAPVLPAHAV